MKDELLFLSRRKVKREDLQLIGATACLISCKIDERIPPLLVKFQFKGGPHGTEVAFALLTQLPWVRLSAFPKIF